MRSITPDLVQASRDVDPAQAQIFQNASMIQSFNLNNTSLTNSLIMNSGLQSQKSLIKTTPQQISKSTLKLSRNVHSSKSIERSGSKGHLNQNIGGSFGMNNHNGSGSQNPVLTKQTIQNNTIASLGGGASDNNSSINGLTNGFQNNIINQQNTNSIGSHIQSGRTSAKFKLEDDVLFRGKYKALKAENKKLKELLRTNESILGSKINESKYEQQQTVALCNLIFPIISGVLGAKNFQNPNSPQPKTFSELINQLEELHQAIKKGSIGNLVVDFQVAKAELSIIKKENDQLKQDKAKFDSQVESFKQTIMRNEILHKYKINRFIYQVRELKSLKKQVASYFTSDQNNYQIFSRSNQHKTGADTQMQNSQNNANRPLSFSNQTLKEDNNMINYTSPQQNPLPSFLRVLAAEELLEDREYEQDRNMGHIDSPSFINRNEKLENEMSSQEQQNQIQQQQPVHQQEKQEKQADIKKSKISNQFPIQVTKETRSRSHLLDASKNTSIPEISSQDLGPKKYQQQVINLNNMKGLHFHQQSNNYIGSGQISMTSQNQNDIILTQPSQIQIITQAQQRRKQELGDGSETQRVNKNDIKVEMKKDDRKSSFSPSIFVRRYLPFFK
ncbi:UNKNOWN [Stylonychia lemnae]|uniref:Uncharacterized protein n=1 Tax=Stylonychia lemnae TaxID=5949 RepID=A0A078ADU9_STYLE|nr:UNKNOWN [Stylonychia lemnae]|eukprot:CDW80385.1 UNKNOWN [Stylonychia lemnae]